MIQCRTNIDSISTTFILPYSLPEFNVKNTAKGLKNIIIFPRPFSIARKIHADHCFGFNALYNLFPDYPYRVIYANIFPRFLSFCNWQSTQVSSNKWLYFVGSEIPDKNKGEILCIGKSISVKVI